MDIAIYAIAAVLSGALGFLSSLAAAQNFPVRTVRIVSGFAPGGATDVAARAVSQRLSELLGQSVVVENRPGAAGIVAAELVARSAPDGHMMYIFSSIASTLSQIQSRRLRAIAVSTLKRSAVLSDVPTLHEAGLPGYDASSWYGLIIPAATPPAVLSRLSNDMIKALEFPEVKERLVSQGIVPAAGGTEEFRKYVMAEIPKWAKVIREAKIPPQ